MRWIGRLLGGVRDFDVLMENLQYEASSLTASEQRAFKPILQKIQTQRSVATTELLKGLQSDRYLYFTGAPGELLNFSPLQILIGYSSRPGS